MSDNVDRGTLLREMRAMKEEFIQIATELDKHNDNVKITRVTGGTAGVVGGGLGIGLILAPLTGGISLLVGIVGVGVSIAGALTGLGGWGVGKLIEKYHLKQADLKWKAFCKHFNMYGEQRVRDFEARQSMVEVVGGAVKKWHKVMVAVTGVIDKADDIASVLTTGSRVVTAGTRTAATAGRVASAFASPMAILSFVGMGLSVFDIVRGAMDIHKETKSPAGDHLRKLAQQLDELIDLVEKY